MSRIRVWVEPEGNWSKEFSGLDKIHLIKDAILHGCRRCYFEEENECEILVGLEIDAYPLEVSNEEYTDLPDEVIRWGAIEKLNGVCIESARIFKLPLDLFEEMAKAEKVGGHLYPIYQAIFNASKVTEPIPDGYCLLFKFEDE